MTCNAGPSDPADCVRIVKPSEWTFLDLSNYIFFRNVFERPKNNNPETQSIEDSPIVQNREIVCGSELVMWATQLNAVGPCKRGYKVQFPFYSAPRTMSNTSYDTAWRTVQ